MDTLKIIPQLFYDLIARVIPGGVAIFAFATAVNKKVGTLLTDAFAGAPTLQQSALLLTIVMLVFAYLLGHLLSTLSDLFKQVTVKALRHSHFRVLKDAIKTSDNYPEDVRRFLFEEMNRLSGNEGEALNDRHYTRAIYIWYDWLRITNPEVGSRLTKLRAESAMYERLAGAMIISVLLHLIAVVSFDIRWNWLVVISGIILAFLGMWGHAQGDRIFQASTINHYYLERTKR